MLGFFWAGTPRTSSIFRRLGYVCLTFGLSGGLVLNNCRAACRGLMSHGKEPFHRTPKAPLECQRERGKPTRFFGEGLLACVYCTACCKVWFMVFGLSFPLSHSSDLVCYVAVVHIKQNYLHRFGKRMPQYVVSSANKSGQT